MSDGVLLCRIIRKSEGIEIAYSELLFFPYIDISVANTFSLHYALSVLALQLLNALLPSCNACSQMPSLQDNVHADVP